MIKKKFYKKLIPSYRHKTDIEVLDKYCYYLKNNFFKKYIQKKNLIVRKKKFYSDISLNILCFYLKFTLLSIKQPVYSLKPYKKFFVLEDLFGNNFYMPGFETLSPGHTYIPYKFFFDFKRTFNFKGIPIYLADIPLNAVFSNISNFFLNKITFSKASGTFCKIRKKKKKKKKLILITLPSKTLYYLPYKTIVFWGKNQNFTTNKLVEGKYGFSFYKSKKIKVRGVAMNPVDHPNGGRTKTVQPEKSPWAWIAKQKK